MNDAALTRPQQSAPPAVRNSLAIELVERGLVPDALTRLGMRRLLADRLRQERVGEAEPEHERLMRLVETIKRAPLAVDTAAANAQHYEVPAGFYRLALGKRLKYSSCLYADAATTLDQAEEAMLALTCERAGVADRMDVLELGCGWGSLSLWMAEHHPTARITGVSNSNSQREYIMGQARARGLGNLTIITADLVDFATDARFDRVVSVECFEHLRNYRELFRRIAGWLRPDGRLFTHVFTHRTCSYFFQDEGDDDWMARHFFTGGIMPADQLFLYFQEHLAIEQHWRVNGTHYARTARGWLDNLDRRRGEVEVLFAADHGPTVARRMAERWRMFFMACEELWGYAGGNEWMVSHYRFAPHALR